MPFIANPKLIPELPFSDDEVTYRNSGIVKVKQDTDGKVVKDKATGQPVPARNKNVLYPRMMKILASYGLGPDQMPAVSFRTLLKNYPNLVRLAIYVLQLHGRANLLWCLKCIYGHYKNLANRKTSTSPVKSETSSVASSASPPSVKVEPIGNSQTGSASKRKGNKLEGEKPKKPKKANTGKHLIIEAWIT
jgi:hypothetical protein